MLKKLQNLLFEDEDDDDDDDDEAEEEKKEIPVQSAPVQPVVTKPVQPAQPAQTIQRIDVEKAVSPSHTDTVEPKKQTLGITVDDISEKKETVKKAETPAVVKKTETKKPVPKKQPAYEFKPVISPIFGVDEKDVDALKTTNQRINSQEKKKDRQDVNITPIISPMYGPEASSNGARSIDDATAENVDDIAETPDIPDDDLPDFSLDDILKSRDQEFENSRQTAKKEEPLFPDLEDEPLPDVAAGNKNAEETKADEDDSFFPDLKFDDDDDDTTSVIEKQDISKVNKK